MKYFVYDEENEKLIEYGNKEDAVLAARKVNARVDTTEESGYSDSFYVEAIEITEERYNALLPEMKQYRFIDVVPGEKANNGGEYGFCTDLYPTDTKGFFRVISSCTCDFDACGTGYEGVQFFTAADIDKMQAKSDKVEAEGSLYCR